MFTRTFWKAAAERAIRAGAIVASFAWGTTAATEVGQLVGPAEATAVGFVWGAIGSLLLSLAGAQVGEKGEPSFTGAEVIAPPTSLPEADPVAEGDDLDFEG